MKNLGLTAGSFHETRRTALFAIFFVMAAMSSFLCEGCGCGQKEEIRFIDESNFASESSRLEPGKYPNPFQAYIKEIDNIRIIKKVKKTGDSGVYNLIPLDKTVLLPYEEAFNEGMLYYKSKRFEDAIKCLKKALSYPNLPDNKVLEVKFLLMSSLRECGREAEYAAQLNEYKQKYREVTQSSETEFVHEQQQSAIIFTLLKRRGEKDDLADNPK